MKLNISQIQLGTNVRKDKPIDEDMVQSIMMHGIHTPVAISKDGNELVFGYRRIQHLRHIWSSIPRTNSRS